MISLHFMASPNRSRQFGSGSLEAVQALHALGAMMHMQQKESNAERLHRRADAIQASAAEGPIRFGAEHMTSDAVSSMVSLAAMHSSRGHHDDAIRLNQRALELEEAAAGRTSRTLAPILLSLANSFEDAGRHYEAQNCRQRAADLLDYSMH
jgi:hypothetical protein